MIRNINLIHSTKANKKWEESIQYYQLKECHCRVGCLRETSTSCNEILLFTKDKN